MSDAEAEVWAEELTKLVEQEEARGDSKLHQMAQDLNKGAPDPFPQSMSGPKFPSELFSKLPPTTP